MINGILLLLCLIFVVGFIGNCGNCCKRCDSCKVEQSDNSKCSKFFGAADLKDQSFEKLNVYGAANLEDVKVAGDTEIKGVLNAKKCQFKELEVLGAANITDVRADEVEIMGATNAKELIAHDVEIKGATNISNSTIENLKIFGALNVENSNIKDVKATAEKVVFKNSHVVSLDILKVTFFKKQKLELIDSTIDGNVKFEKDGGEIILYGKSVISGKVEGATIIKK
ncbi:TPA: hypothetical protein DEO28_00140 [Candidatus Dependentiae bacterium]|nr:MAG: hypothetical protein UR14_C0001G0114 [candidate division TM6 bacterium GW2011_GWE2_31_21]KKP54006.1 MAG: hypothetical protein UR43_C0001G0024 [candidate division TM6 bacterium GW2011_GWF2_33_332]HBS48413.1 hypothetical protein [Candidatus Dependentiae bacterium]HBZ72913.1 hypothetical protein [Candidatus Dependentiae bacterium]